jgi:hypothetical protein
VASLQSVWLASVVGVWRPRLVWGLGFRVRSSGFTARWYILRSCYMLVPFAYSESIFDVGMALSCADYPTRNKMRV